MNRYYYEENNKTCVITDSKDLRVIDSKNNISDILITENNIEEIEKELDKIKIKKNNTNFNNIIKYPLITFLIGLGIAIPINNIPYFEYKIIAFLCSLGLYISSIIQFKKILNKDDIKNEYCNKSITELEKCLNNEKGKLQELKEKS